MNYIMYMILDYLLDCRINGHIPDLYLMNPSSLDSDSLTWSRAISTLYGRGFIEGYCSVNDYGDVTFMRIENPYITESGMEFLMLDPDMDFVRRSNEAFDRRSANVEHQAAK